VEEEELADDVGSLDKRSLKRGWEFFVKNASFKTYYSPVLKHQVQSESIFICSALAN